MGRIKYFILGTTLVTFFLCGVVFAEKAGSKKSRPGKRVEGNFIIETRKDGSVVKYKKKQSYDFEGTDIEGLFKRPSGSYISNIQDVKGRSIIRIRKNFDSEVIDSARLLH